MKKSLSISFLTLLAVPFVMGQSPVFKNNLSNINPAMTGVVDKHFAMIQGRFIRSFDQLYYSFENQYEIGLDSINAGIGVNINFSKDHIFNNKSVRLKYGHSFQLKDELSLSVGASAGLNQSEFRHGFSINNSTIPSEYTLNSSTHFGSVGSIISWRGLTTGVSLLTSSRIISSSDNNYVNQWSTFVWYDFEVTDNFKLAPSWIAQTDFNYQMHSFGLRGEHFNTFWWIAGYGFNKYSFDTTQLVNLGAGFQLAERINIGYALLTDFNPNSFSNNLHLFTLAFRVGR